MNRHISMLFDENLISTFEDLEIKNLTFQKVEKGPQNLLDRMQQSMQAENNRKNTQKTDDPNGPPGGESVQNNAASRTNSTIQVVWSAEPSERQV